MAKLLKLQQYDRNCLQLLHKEITSSPSQHIPIAKMATRAGINRTKLTTGFKLLYGVGIYEYQVMLRLEKAEELLCETDLDVKEIAILTGYTKNTIFNVAFKKKHGCSPLQWRCKNQISEESNHNNNCANTTNNNAKK